MRWLMHRAKCFLPLFFLLLVCLQGYAYPAKGKLTRKEQTLEDKAKKWDIDISQKFKSDAVTGKPVTGLFLAKDLLRFFECLEYLPENFVKRSSINKVVILDDLKLRNVPAGGVAAGNVMVLRKGFQKHVFYHELFHIFDDTVHTNKKWCNLNPKDFVYKGSDFYDVDLKKRDAKKVEKNSWLHKMMPHFVSEYAMSFEHEDRAEVFASMVVEGKDFRKRTAKSSVMRKKMNMIMDMTESKRLLGRDFWKKRLNGKSLE